MEPNDQVEIPYERFPALSHAAPGLEHAFTRRVPGLDVALDREAVLRRLNAGHAALRGNLGFGGHHFGRGEQIHGSRVVEIVESPMDIPVPGVDGVMTCDARVVLGVYVADCAAVYVVDPVRRALGLAHSGRKGTELNITQNLILGMCDTFGCEPSDMIVQISPCIRPPYYEIDFAAEIVRQAIGTGVSPDSVHDCGICTGAKMDQYYSYRREKGLTGRMLALLGWV
jgi:copper oxidase (laccase) domain-containing protein